MKLILDIMQMSLPGSTGVEARGPSSPRRARPQRRWRETAAVLSKRRPALSPWQLSLLR
jgi:hypothetical protein